MRETIVEYELTPDLISEIVTRSSNGEGVRQIISEKGLPVEAVMKAIQKDHASKIAEAKVKYRSRLLGITRPVPRAPRPPNNSVTPTV